MKYTRIVWTDEWPRRWETLGVFNLWLLAWTRGGTTEMIPSRYQQAHLDHLIIAPQIQTKDPDSQEIPVATLSVLVNLLDMALDIQLPCSQAEGGKASIGCLSLPGFHKIRLA